jgi:hypothetical protein
MEYVSYQWNKDGTAIPGATGMDYTPTEPGSYTVTVSTPGYQSKTSDPVTVTAPGAAAVSISVEPAYQLSSSTGRLTLYSLPIFLELSNGVWKEDGNTLDSTIPADTIKTLVDITLSGKETVAISQFYIELNGRGIVLPASNKKQILISYVYDFDPGIPVPDDLGEVTVTLDQSKLAGLREHTTVTGSLTAGTLTATEAWTELE